jgi:ribose transport system substrate-binding protein
MKTVQLTLILVLVAVLASGCAQGTPAPSGSSGAATTEQASGATTQVGKIGGADRSDQEYVWISQFSTLPMFVERVYPGLDAFARDFGVKVRKAGPTVVDLAAYIATVEQECARKPAGVIVVGGWDQALQEPVNKCIAQKVPVIVTDGDLFTSNRLSYVGTDWYNLGVRMAEFQLAEHERRGLDTCEVAMVYPVANENMQRSRNGIVATFEGTKCKLVAEEDNNSDVAISAQQTAALLSAYPNLTGMIGVDSEAGPGIVTAIDEAGKTGELVVTVNERGREFLQNLKDGKVQLITMEKYDLMNYLALFMLYTFHNDAIRVAGIDPWETNWMPKSVDSGLLLVTKDNVDQVMKYMEEAEKAAATQQP